MKAIALLSTALLLVSAPALADEAPPERADAVRVRGGISAGGGFVYAGSSVGSAVAPAVGLSGRLGVQINHPFSLYYQNMGVVVIDGGGVGILDYNSFMANLTASHLVDIGFGPSVDVVTVSASSRSATAVLFGLHGRLAVNFGASGTTPRRSGFSVGLDLHPTFGPGGTLFTMAAGVGYEWY
ncbi:MAG: hypothetical protein QM820_11560 [Minicystis sp.]